MGPGSLYSAYGVSREACWPCPEGTFSGAPGATNCTQCPLGSTSGSNSSACAPCGDAEGGYVEFVRASRGAEPFAAGRCGRCADAVVAVGALTCPAGQGRSSCAVWEPCGACPAGGFGVPSSDLLWDTCVACPAGSVTAAPGATACEACPPGSTTPNAGGTECQPCAPGRYGVSGVAAAGSAAARVAVALCPACPPGTYAPGRGTVGACTPCPRGRTHFTSGRRSEADCVVAFDTAAGTLRVTESVSWMQNTSNYGLTRTGRSRTLDVSAAGAAVDVAAAADVAYDTEVEVLYDPRAPPRPKMIPLDKPLRTGVASYNLYKLATGSAQASGAAAQSYALTVWFTDGGFATCSDQSPRSSNPSPAPPLVLSCKHFWSGGGSDSDNVTETVTLTAAAV